MLASLDRDQERKGEAALSFFISSPLPPPPPPPPISPPFCRIRNTPMACAHHARVRVRAFARSRFSPRAPLHCNLGRSIGRGRRSLSLSPLSPSLPLEMFLFLQRKEGEWEQPPTREGEWERERRRMAGAPFERLSALFISPPPPPPPPPPLSPSLTLLRVAPF